MTMNAETLCTFFLAGMRCGLPAEQVREVVRPLPLTSVHLAPASVCGLCNLKGEILAVIDLRRRLGMPCEGDPRQGIFAVVDVRGHVFCLLVDEVDDVVKIDASKIRPPGGLQIERAGECIKGVVEDDKKQFVILDPAALAVVG